MARGDPPHVIHRVKLYLRAKNFWPVAPLFYLFIYFLMQKYRFWIFLNTERGVAIYACDVPLLTLILNIYGFVGLAPFFLCYQKYHF